MTDRASFFNPENLQRLMGTALKSLGVAPYVTPPRTTLCGIDENRR